MLKMKFAVKFLSVAFLLTSTAVSAQYTERKIRISSGTGSDNPISIGVKKMQEILDAKTGGKLKLNAYYSGALGPDSQTFQALRSGTLEMVIGTPAPIMGMIKEIGVLDLPFLFANEKEADAILDGPAGDYFNKKMEEFGLVNLAYWENGFRNLTNSKRPVNKLEDMAGLKIRVMQNAIFIDTFKELGINAVPMPFSELYSSLETKAIDGQENPNINFEAAKIDEVQKYLATTRHAYSCWAILYSKKLWDQLSNEERDALKSAAMEARLAQRAANRIANKESQERMKGKGMVVSEFSEQEREKMKEKVKPIYDKYLSSFSNKEGSELVISELKKMREK